MVTQCSQRSVHDGQAGVGNGLQSTEAEEREMGRPPAAVLWPTARSILGSTQAASRALQPAPISGFHPSGESRQTNVLE